MRSSVRFFMNADDREVFEEYLRSLRGVEIRELDNGQSIITGPACNSDLIGCIHWRASEQVNGVLSEGWISLTTTGFGLEDRLCRSDAVDASESYREV
jgi:hypothetical protein